MGDSVDDQFVKYPTGKIGKGKFCDTCAKFNSRQVCSHAMLIREGKILMIKRAKDPMNGYWAIPAGYLDWDETAEECAVRELGEEAGLVGKNPKLFGVYSDPERDEDGRQNLGVVYLVEMEGETELSTPDEVEEVKWFGLDELPEKIAFDHRRMIEDYKNNV